jgi:hypothetical protein
MQQRRLRLGDILDDYCPRERRITNHAVVAMIEDEVKQTRCTTCDADHEYRHGRMPLSRRRKRDELTPPGAPPESGDQPLVGDVADASGPDDDAAPLSAFETPDTEPAAEPDAEPDEDNAAGNDEGPVHRRLIRATLPRPEGQAPERKAPDFTVRQPGGRFDQHRGGQRQRGGRQGREGQRPDGGGPPTRFGGQRHGGSGQQDQRQGGNNNRFGNPQGQRGSRPQGPGRGPRPGGGQGRKRGR